MLQPSDNTVARRVLISASLALVVMIAEYILLIRDEVKIIWPKIRSTWSARFYICTRYIGLSTQILNVAFAVRMYLGIHTSPLGCRFWFGYQAVVVQVLLISVEYLLMRRLWALYFESRLILLILCLIAVFQTASMVGNPGNAVFSATTMTTNSIIFFMTFWRYFRLPTKWTREGIGRVVMRDAAAALSAITAIMLFLTLCSLQVIKPTMSGNITFYWLVAVLWVSVGRIIVNYEHVPTGDSEQQEGNTWRGTLQLTSQIEMGESTLSLDTQCASSDVLSSASRTLQSSLLTPMTKASQLSPLSGSSRDSNWFGDRLSVTQPSSTAVSTELSFHGHSPSDVSAGDVQQTEANPQPNEGNGPVHSRTPSPQPPSSELSPSEVSA